MALGRKWCEVHCQRLLGVNIPSAKELTKTLLLDDVEEMALSDKALGGLMLIAAAVIFVYYTVWGILLPFFPLSHPIHEFFPAREWAIRIPALLLVVGLAVVGLFVGIIMAKESSKAKKKGKLTMKAA